MSSSSDDEVDDDLQSRFVLVDDIDTLSVAIDTLAEPEVQDISIDAEGTNLCRKGKVCILQIGLPRSLAVAEDVYIIDVLALGKQAFEHEEEGHSLKSIMEDARVTKWACDCRMDSDALYHHFGVRMRGVVDLQLAEVALRRLNGDPAPRVIGLRGLLDKYLPVDALKEMLPYRTKTEAIKAAFDADPRSWERRPLTHDQVLYAATDVAYMARLASLVYTAMPDDFRAKVDRVSEERVLWFAEPDEKALFDGAERAIAPLF